MFGIAICFFSLAAIFGVVLVIHVLLDKKPPRAIAILHGLSAATGLVLLFIHALTAHDQTIWPAGIFVVVALVGIFLASKDLRGQKIPRSIAIVHGLVAAGTFAYLIYLYFR
jgi:peptidoglycan/LPS O-acetylase OafA/YrhL